MRIILLPFKEYSIKGFPFGLSLFIPLWFPLRAENFLLAGSPYQSVSLLSPVVFVRDVHDSKFVDGSGHIISP